MDAPDADDILAEPPCGYFLTEEQYSAANLEEGTVAERLALHGISATHAPDRGFGPGYLVPMTQPLRGLIPLLLDGQAAEPMVDGVRLFAPATGNGAPLPDEACGRGRAVPTAGIEVEHDLTYITD